MVVVVAMCLRVFKSNPSTGMGVTGEKSHVATERGVMASVILSSQREGLSCTCWETVPRATTLHYERRLRKHT